MASERFVASIHTWMQTSGDYDSERCVRTLVVSADTPIGDVMRWADSVRHAALGCGYVKLTTAEEIPHAN